MGAGRLVLVARGVVPGAAGEPNDAGRTASVTDTPAKQAPRALKTRTTSPSPGQVAHNLALNPHRPTLPPAHTPPAVSSFEAFRTPASMQPSRRDWQASENP